MLSIEGLLAVLSFGAEMIVDNVESASQNFHITIEEACKGLDISRNEYEEAKAFLANQSKNEKKAIGA